MHTQTDSQALLDFLDEGVICCDASGNIIRANQSATRLLGLEPLAYGSIDKIILKLGAGSEALKELEVDNSSMLVIGGSLIEAKKKMLENNPVIVLTDRSEELRWQSQLAEHGHMLSSNTEAYLVIDGRGLIRYANNFCERERGYENGEMVGLQLRDIEIGRDEDGVSAREYTQEDIEQRLDNCLRRGQVERYEAWHVRKGGSIFPTDVSLRPYRMSSEVVLLLTAQDESSRYRQLQALMEARAEAESSNNAKSAFMAVTSHELRTPLTTIIGFLELLKLDYGEGEGDLPNYLELMHKSSKSLLRLIEDILDFTKIESKALKLDMKSIDMVSFLNQVNERWLMRFAKESVEFVFEPVGNIDGTMKSDPVRLNQLLDNLIGNAQKFTVTGSVTLRVTRSTDSYCFEIIDTGCGIDESHVQKIFEPFYQVDDAMTRRSDGTGLGLYICKNLSHILGGAISVSRSDTSGSCFELIMPLQGPQ